MAQIGQQLALVRDQQLEDPSGSWRGARHHVRSQMDEVRTRAYYRTTPLGLRPDLMKGSSVESHFTDLSRTQNLSTRVDLI